MVGQGKVIGLKEASRHLFSSLVKASSEIVALAGHPFEYRNWKAWAGA